MFFSRWGAVQQKITALMGNMILTESQLDRPAAIESPSASATDWHESCRELARLRQPFAIQGFNAGHWEFFEEISHTYHYELRPLMSKLVFVPLDTETSAQSGC